jgi:DNA-binding NtrC family response regulator
VRLDAARGKGVTTNRRHEAMALPPFDRELAPLLDGTRDMEGIRRKLEQAVSENRITVTVEGESGQPADLVARVLDETIRHRLEALRRAACLVA